MPSAVLKSHQESPPADTVTVPLRPLAPCPAPGHLDPWWSTFLDHDPRRPPVQSSRLPRRAGPQTGARFWGRAVADVFRGGLHGPWPAAQMRCEHGSHSSLLSEV